MMRRLRRRGVPSGIGAGTWGWREGSWLQAWASQPALTEGGPQEVLTPQAHLSLVLWLSYNGPLGPALPQTHTWLWSTEEWSGGEGGYGMWS